MKLLTGMTGYLVIWLGHFFGAMGAAMTTFALSLWVWDQTHSATALALVQVFAMLPVIFFSPVAGALVDRWNKHLKLVMMIADLGRLANAIIILMLLSTGNLSMIWLYALVCVEGMFLSFQWPSASAATTVMLRKEDYARAGGIQSMVLSASTIVAPILGAWLYTQVGLERILQLDVLGCILAVLAILVVFIPVPPTSEEGRASQQGLFKESLFGFKFILSHPSLLGLQVVFLIGNLFFGFYMTLLAPLILARTGDNAQMLATVQSVAGITGVLAGLLLAAWGGFKKRIHGVFVGWVLSQIMLVIFGLGQSMWVWVVATIGMGLSGPLVNSSNQAIWQSKTPPDIQGKVFSARRVIAQCAAPVAALIAGPLIDHVLGPAMMESGKLASLFGPVVGVGSGAGISLLFVFLGMLGTFLMLMAYRIRVIREVEILMPDFDEKK